MRDAARRGRWRGPAVALLAMAGLLAACGGGRSVVRPAAPPAPAPAPAHMGARSPASPPPAPAPPPPPPGLLAALPEPTRAGLVAAGRGWLGRKGAFQAGGRRFHADCSGYVEAVYESMGIPVRDAIAIRPEDEWRASAALHRAARELGVLYGAEREPLPGDLVFFENTYDRNRNGQNDDGITHVGLVEAVLADGTVRFLHRGGRGVVRGALRLAAPELGRGPDGEPWNTPLRAARASDARGTRYLAGALFAGFGRIDPARVASVLDGNGRLDLAALGYGEPDTGIQLPPGR